MRIVEFDYKPEFASSMGIDQTHQTGEGPHHQCRHCGLFIIPGECVTDVIYRYHRSGGEGAAAVSGEGGWRRQLF